LVQDFKWPLEKALPFFTTNVAYLLQLENKGEVTVGKDADLLVFDQSFGLQYVIANGQILRTPTWTKVK